MGNKRKSKGRRWIASLLIAVMLVSVLPIDALASELSVQGMTEQENADAVWEEAEIPEGIELAEPDAESNDIETETPVESMDMGDITVKSTNSFGALLAEAYSAEAAEQEQNNGCNVFSVEMTGNQAAVDFETVEDGTLVVCVYEEDGEKMLASGSMEVESGATSAVVTIETETMPAYFYLRAFLVDSVTLRPFCTAYESPMYTQEMQEFLSKTTDDFAADRVLNLDEDKTNNFAVYEDETKIIEADQTNNVVVSIDDVNRIYVIENPDSSVTSLAAGDIFSCEYGDGEFLIVKVASLSVEGNRATITGADVSMEDVFAYVKIDESVGTQDASVDVSNLEEGVSYEGLEEDAQMLYADGEIPNDRAVSVDVSQEKAFKYSMTEKKIGGPNANVTVNGGLGLKVKNTLKLYITLSEQYVEIRMDYSMYMNAKISGKVSGSISLGTYGFMPIAGVIIEISPSFEIEVSAKVEFAGTLGGTVGLRVSGKEGIVNLTSSPKFQIEVRGEIKIYAGIALNPRVKIISDSVVKMEFEGEVGAEATGVMAVIGEKPSSEKKHDCGQCLDGEIIGKIHLSAGVQFFKSNKLKFTMSFDKSVKISDFYWSWTYGEFGFKNCPHWTNRVTVEVINKVGGKPKSGVIANGSEKTDENGKAVLWLPKGKQKIILTAEGMQNTSKKVTVVDGGNWVRMKMLPKQAGTGGGTEPEEPEKPEPEVKEQQAVSLSLGGSHSGAIASDGSLYMWGDNFYGQLGLGSRWMDAIVPKKIMDDVVTLSLGDNHSGAITGDGSLYMWGCNDNGELGDGTTEWRHGPVKVMDNVISVSLGDRYSGAITSDGSLYMWGNNEYGQLGDGSTTDRYRPTKIMDDVVSVNLGTFDSGAITSDGSLYIWGDSHYGEEDGRYEEILRPIKIMDDVTSVNLGTFDSGAITNDGSLYMWGLNDYGELGDGTTELRYNPVKILDNVVSVSLGDNHSGAITSDGSLYMWGDNMWGELGDGSTINRYRPTKILDGVVSLSLGGASSGAITSDGSLYMWGFNIEGELGDGTTENRSTPTRISIPSLAINTASEMPIDNTALDISVFETIEEAAPFTATGITVPSGATELTGLQPGEVYNYYVLKSRSGENLLLAENLLYLSQLTADKNGTLQLSGEPRENWKNPAAFVVGMTKQDISGVEVNVRKLTANGKEQYVTAYVSLNGKRLTEGRDYVLSGDYRATTAGKYKIKITGVGDYTGSKEVEWEMKGSAVPIDPDEPDKPKPPVPEKEWYFTDIPQTPGYWKYDNVKYVYDRGVMNGISGTTLFEPDSKLNRAMFATVLYRMAGSPEVTFTDKFTDVKDGQYYSKAVIWANSKGIVSGFQDGSYGVTANITREQIAKMLCEYAKKQGYDVSGASSLEAYTDKDSVNSWAVDYLKWAVNTGMISGKPNGDGNFRLDPKGEATRAECAKMLTMFMKKYEE